MSKIFAIVLLALIPIIVAEREILDQETHDKLLTELKSRRGQLQSWFMNRMFGSKGREEVIIECPTCQLAITLALSFLEQGTEDEVEQALINLCIDLEIVDDDVCEGIVRLEFPSVYHLLKNRPLQMNDLCGFLLQNMDCGVLNDTLTSWDISIDPDMPTFVEPDPLPETLETVQILHLTDIHPDALYAEGSLTECTKPMCCRRGEGWEEPWNSTVEAGHFGDYRCDIPLHTMKNVFNHAASLADSENYNYKFVMLGGDYVHHAVWDTTREGNLEHYKAVADAMHEAFPDTPIYPVIGNHEPHPVNLFPPTSLWSEGFDNSWVFNTLAEHFLSEFPEEAQTTFRKAGYYSISPETGVRVLVLNTNFCYILNFWILYEPEDPEDQLQWFADQMKLAEEAEEKVFIVGHVPPGSNECWSVWNEKFNRIVNRFRSIIVGQFYGHTHYDDFKIYFDGVEPTGSLYIGASATTYTDLNPGYKVFHVDGARGPESTWEMADHETWIYNLTVANAAEVEPSWYKLYSAKEEYGLDSLRPKDLVDFTIRMAKDNDLFQKFYRHFNKDADTMIECNDEDACRRDYLCSILTANDADRSHCSLVDDILGPTVRA